MWSDDESAVTPNRFPFAEHQLMLWSRRPRREPDEAFLRTCLKWCSDLELTALMNTIGAAASIPRAHAHITPEVSPFLDALPQLPLAADWLPDLDDVDFVTLELPLCYVGICGTPAARARATIALNERRMTAACSLIVHRDVTWVVPRSPVEVPRPHFGHAVGAAEIWGRFCYLDEAVFEAARGEDLEQALITVGRPLPQP